MIELQQDHSQGEAIAQGVLSLTSAGVSEGQPQLIQHEVSLPGELTLELPAGSQWTLSTAAEGYWLPTRRITLDGPDIAATITAFPAGTLEGTLKIPAQDHEPTSLSAHFQPSPSMESTLSETIPRELLSATQSCSLNNLHFRCVVPAVHLDIRFEPGGFIPHYQWDVHVKPKSATPIGVLELRKGSSLSGWLAAAAPDQELSGAIVELLPVISGFAGREEHHRKGVRTFTTHANQRGFFQLVGLAPGAYTLTAKLGSSFVEVTPVESLVDTETILDFVQLQPPRRLEAEIEPPVDPFGRRWKLELRPANRPHGAPDSAHEAFFSAEGSAVLTDLQPREYRLTISDSRASNWHFQNVELQLASQTLDIDLPFMRLEGTLVLGEDPVAAEVWFGGRNHVPGIRVDSNEEGKFYVFLPTRPRWRVDVVNSGLGLNASFPDVVTPQRQEDEPWAKLLLEVPDTSVTGEVVDAAGQVVHASVHLRGSESALIGSTGEDGRFQFRGLAPGSWTLQAFSEASDSRRNSDMVKVLLEEEQNSAPITLVLEDDQRLSGQILDSANRGIPGARIVILPEMADSSLPMRQPEVYSDLSGVFEFALPKDVAAVQLTVFAPGFAVKQQRVSLPQPDPIFLPLGQIGGTVRVQLGDIEVGPDSPRWKTFIFREFAIGFPSTIAQWASLHGLQQPRTGFVVPMLEPGTYRACVDIGPAVFSPELLSSFEDHCVAGFLPPYGELVLDLSPLLN